MTRRCQINTPYRNDYKLLDYPFASNKGTQVPRGLIKALSICLSPKCDDDVIGDSVVKATSIEITSNSVTLALGLSSGRFLGCITAVIGKGAGTMHMNYNDMEVSAFMLLHRTMHVDNSSIPLDADLDPNCVTVIPYSSRGNMSTVTVDRKVYQLGELLEIRTGGMLSMSLFDLPLELQLECKVPKDVVTFNNKVNPAYEMVTSINESRPLSDDHFPLLDIITDLLNKNVYAQVDNAQLHSQMSESSYDPDLSADYGKRQVFWIRLDDINGDAVVLTFIGTGDFPHCFGPDDESGASLVSNNTSTASATM